MASMMLHWACRYVIGLVVLLSRRGPTEEVEEDVSGPTQHTISTTACCVTSVLPLVVHMLAPPPRRLRGVDVLTDRFAYANTKQTRQRPNPL